MKRRDFLRTASAVAGASAAASTAVAQEETTEAEDGEGDGGGGGGTAEVIVGPGGDFTFEPGTNEPLYITPGTTVMFVWDSNTHNIVVESQPDDAEWEGHETIEDEGFEYEFTFEVEGEYAYYCEPHRQSGMEATIVVNQEGAPPGDGAAAPAEADPEHMGVPFQAHFVGLATILMMIVSVIYTFFFLKYGESANTKGGNN